MQIDIEKHTIEKIDTMMCRTHKEHFPSLNDARYDCDRRRKLVKKTRNSHHQICYWVTGTATKHPMMVQDVSAAIAALLTTISHCPRVITGFKTRVSGAVRSGTALIILNRAVGSTGRRGDSGRALIDLEGGEGLVAGSCLLHLC